MWKADVQHDSDDGEFIRELFFEHVDFPVDHRMGYLRVDLGRRDVLMPEHLGKRFQRDAVRQADRGSISMPRKVERELFVDAAFPGYVFKAVVDGIKGRYLKKITIACQPSILIQNEQRIGQQFDDIFRLDLLTLPTDPPIPVRILFELIVGQRRHIGITDTRKAGEQEHVAVIILTLVAQAGSHHTPKFILGQETTLRIRYRILVKGKGLRGIQPLLKAILTTYLRHVR